MNAEVDGGDRPGRHGIAAEGGLANVVMHAQQRSDKADAEQVDHGIDDVVVEADRTEEQSNPGGELDGDEGDEEPVELMPDGGQIEPDLEQMQGGVGTEHQNGKVREGEEPGEEEGPAMTSSPGMMRAVLVRDGIGLGNLRGSQCG